MNKHFIKILIITVIFLLGFLILTNNKYIIPEEKPYYTISTEQAKLEQLVERFKMADRLRRVQGWTSEIEVVTFESTIFEKKYLTP